ncbi:MAG: AzlC family ABC transporter permease [Treponema sp.]|nr:AzlC family ABC transporter permease [Treponema sp.]
MDAYIFRQCRRITAPIFFGYIAIGIPFGVMIVQAGYPWWMSLFMSLVMYSGAGQYIAAGLLGAGAGILEIVLTEFFVNIRHIVYGLSLIEKSKKAGRWKLPLVFTLTDETYAVLTSTDVPPGVPAGPFLGMIGILDFVYWTLGCVIGALACSFLATYGLSDYLTGVDFALTSLFVIILFSQIKASGDLLPPLTGFVSCLLSVILCRTGLLVSSNIIFLAIILGIDAILLARGRGFASGGARQLATFVSFIVCSLVLAGLLVLMSLSEGSGGAASPAGNSGMAVAICASVLSGGVIFCERLFPFALFSKRNPPPAIQFVARYIPSMVIAILIVYSLKDVDLRSFPFGIPQLAGGIMALLLNVLVKNYLVTIFGSTAVFMVLSRFLQG